MIQKIPSHLLTVILFGALSQIGQVLLLRELLMVFHGNEVSMGLILASWMAWVGVGSFLGGVIVKPNRDTILLASIDCLSVCLVLPTTILLIRRLRGFFHVVPGAYLTLSHMAISSLFIIAPTGLLLGAQFVFLSKVWREREGIKDTYGGGKTYIFEAVGNMMGGILLTLLLIQHFASLQIVFSTIILLLASILYMASKTRDQKRRISQKRYIALLTLLLLSLLFLPLLGSVDDWGYRIKWQYFTPEHQLVEVHQSKHGTISILQSEDQYSFYQSGHLLFSIAGPQTKRTTLEELEAVTFAHLSLLQHKDPGSVLLIGGGLRGTLTQLAKYPLERIDYIEVDPVLLKAARPYLGSKTLETLEDPRIHTIHTDGRLFVKEAQEKYDLVIVDIPDPTTAVLNRFYTEEFFKECEALLHDDGVFVIHSLSTANLQRLSVANRNTTIYHTLSSVFSHVLTAGEKTLLYLASHCREQITVNVDTLVQRFIEKEIETELFSPHHFHTLLFPSQIHRIEYILRNHGRSPYAHLEGPGETPLFIGPLEEEKREEDLLPVEKDYFINRDRRPIAYYYSLMFFHAMTYGDESKTLIYLLQIKSWWVLPLLGIPVFIVMMKKRRERGQKRGSISSAILFTTFATGLSTMLLQISLLFSFQSIYGFIYELVGLIVAIFMGGLALGAAITLPYSKEKSSIESLAYVQLCMALLAGMIGILLPLIQSISSSPLLFLSFSLLTFLAGLLNGVDFPLVCACYMKIKGGADKTTGMIYGVELLGACLGAVVSSAIIIPILGITTCTLIGALGSLTAFFVLLIARGWREKREELLPE